MNYIVENTSCARNKSEKYIFIPVSQRAIQNEDKTNLLIWQQSAVDLMK